MPPRQQKQPARLLTDSFGEMEWNGGERRRASGSTLDDAGSGSDSAESGAYSEDDYDDSAYGTMARFVPTLVLERLRSEGEAAMASKSSGAGAVDVVTDAPEGANVPKVGCAFPLAQVDVWSTLYTTFVGCLSACCWLSLAFVLLF